MLFWSVVYNYIEKKNIHKLKSKIGSIIVLNQSTRPEQIRERIVFKLLFMFG